MIIKQIREEKGYTQEQIAGILGISRSAYTLKENGKRSFKINELLTLSNIFHKDIKEFYGGILC